MKQAAIALILLLNLLAGCSPTASLTSAIPPASADDTATNMPEAHPPADAIDFGEVTMLLNSRKSEMDESDDKRQQRILAAVSAALQRQTGVRMALRAVPAMNPAEGLRTMAAAGKPPQISIFVPKGYGDSADELDKQVSTTLVPLPLNDSLTTYGGHLRRLIPEDIWRQCTVSGRIMHIPLQKQQSTSGLVLNRAVMEQYGWQTPATVEEFEKLLEKAKTEEIMPLLESPFLYTSRSWFGADGTLTKQDDQWIPIYASQARLDWLQQQKKWIEKEWMQADLDIGAQEEWMNSGRWLCQEMMLDEMGDTADIIVVPPLSLGSGQPTYNVLHPSYFLYESYDKPDALVLLLDWMHESAQNNCLLSLGEEGVDYRLVGMDEYAWIDTVPWQGSYQLPILPIFSGPHGPRSNPQAYEQAVRFAQQYGSQNKENSLPAAAVAFRRAGTRLDRAVQNELKYGTDAYISEMEYLKGNKTLTDHLALLQTNALLMRAYIDLLSESQGGTYDMWQDVQPVS